MPLFGKSDSIQGKTNLRQRYEVVIMPQRSGKSSIQEELAKYEGEKRVVPFDADAMATSIVQGDEKLRALDTTSNAAMLEALLFKQLEERFKEFLEALPEDIVVCITANVRFCDWLKIKDKRVSVFLPSADLYAQMRDTIEKTHSKEDATKLQKSRDEIMMWAQSLECDPKYHTYGHMDEIIKVLAEKFKLHLRAY